MGYSIKSKLVFKDLGNPSVVKGDDAPKEALMGTIIGNATGIKVAKATDGLTELKGLKGTFEGIPGNSEADTIRSGVCYLGEAFQADIQALLEGDNPPEGVGFAFELYAVKANNPAGYSWKLVRKIDVAENDPLAAIKTKAGDVQRLAPPKDEKGKKGE